MSDLRTNFVPPEITIIVTPTTIEVVGEVVLTTESGVPISNDDGALIEVVR